MNLQIVGVIRNERTGGLQAPPEPVVYVPLAQFPRQDISLVVRTRGDPLAAMPGIREAVRQIDPHLPLGEVRTMEQVKEQSMLWAKQPTWVVGAFAGVAALMAALGLYGVLAHAVTQQRREIGIRMALGARPGDVVSNTLRSALSMLLVGLDRRTGWSLCADPRTEESPVPSVRAGPGRTRRCLRSDDSRRHTGGLDPGEPRRGRRSDDGAPRRRLIGVQPLRLPPLRSPVIVPLISDR